MPISLHIFVVQVSSTTLIPACTLFLQTKQTDKDSNSSADAILCIVALGFPYLCTAVHTEKSAVSIQTDIIMAYENSFTPFRLLFCCILLWHFHISHITFGIIFKLVC